MYIMSTIDNLKENFINIADFSKFPMVIGVSVYGLGVVPVLLPIKNSMIKQESFLRVHLIFYFLFK